MYLQLNENNRTESFLNKSAIQDGNQHLDNIKEAKPNHNIRAIDKDHVDNGAGIVFNVNMIFKHIDDKDHFTFQHKIAILDQVRKNFKILSDIVQLLIVIVVVQQLFCCRTIILAIEIWFHRPFITYKWASLFQVVL